MPPRPRRPRGYIEELPSGSYRAVVYAGTGPLTGRRRNLAETTKTYDAAHALARGLAGRLPAVDIGGFPAL